jgi:uncharacterized protein Yka (UPF0111/DUF47 family)
MEALERYVKTRSTKDAKLVTKAKSQSDEMWHILIDELNRAFVTPIDREDIFALSWAIDDVVEYAYTAVDQMETLAIEPNHYLRLMASLLRDVAREILQATRRLDGRPHVASDHAVRAKALENRMEQVYREALADLFHQPQDEEHIVEMLKLREVYRHLSNAADRGDEVANVISSIVIKMA